MCDGFDISPPPFLNCDGWWEQEGLGRQPMEQLRLQFTLGGIRGSGTDVIGPFTFSGTLSQDGRVTMLKQYLGQHSVDYVGVYDGEGVMSGQWRIFFWHGPWMIRIRSAPTDAEASAEQHAVPE